MIDSQTLVSIEKTYLLTKSFYELLLLVNAVIYYYALLSQKALIVKNIQY